MGFNDVACAEVAKSKHNNTILFIDENVSGCHRGSRAIIPSIKFVQEGL